MITQEVKEREQKVSREELVAKLEGEVNIGFSAERLQSNPDWLRLRNKLAKELDDLERQKITTYDLTISGAFGLDQKLTAVDIIKTLHQTIADLRFYVELPNREAKRGVEAQEELSKLREADHG